MPVARSRRPRSRSPCSKRRTPRCSGTARWRTRFPGRAGWCTRLGSSGRKGNGWLRLADSSRLANRPGRRIRCTPRRHPRTCRCCTRPWTGTWWSSCNRATACKCCLLRSRCRSKRRPRTLRSRSPTRAMRRTSRRCCSRLRPPTRRRCRPRPRRRLLCPSRRLPLLSRPTSCRRMRQRGRAQQAGEGSNAPHASSECQPYRSSTAMQRCYVTCIARPQGPQER